MNKNNDESLIGTRYNRLTITGFERKKVGRGWNWIVLCDCGNQKVVSPGDVKNGKVKSCGCYHSECSRERSTKFKNKTVDNKRLYMIFNHMKRRCYDSKSPRYNDYGGRGIKICDKWMNPDDGFDKFVDWSMVHGYDENMTIDRVDVNGDYSPENCAWKTKKEQNSNKRETLWVEYRGERIQLMKLCEREGVSYDTVHNRIRVLGWDVERAINEPSQQENSFSKRCREHGLNPATVKDRIHKLGWTEEEAFNTPSAGRHGGATLANARRKNRICKVCGESFKPNNSKQIYCGEQCRNRSKRVAFKRDNVSRKNA